MNKDTFFQTIRELNPNANMNDALHVLDAIATMPKEHKRRWREIVTSMPGFVHRDMNMIQSAREVAKRTADEIIEKTIRLSTQAGIDLADQPRSTPKCAVNFRRVG